MKIIPIPANGEYQFICRHPRRTVSEGVGVLSTVNFRIFRSAETLVIECTGCGEKFIVLGGDEGGV